jgi:hypothetical protein
VVVDAETVCQAGREIAKENNLEKRVSYLAADLSQDELPTGFDLVILCGVGLFSEDLFRRIDHALNVEGHLVIVDKFAPTRTTAPPSRLSSTFLESLQHPSRSIDFTTIEFELLSKSWQLHPPVQWRSLLGVRRKCYASRHPNHLYRRHRVKTHLPIASEERCPVRTASSSSLLPTARLAGRWG